MATASEILSAIDTAILSLVQNKISSYELNGVRYEYNDLDKLRRLRKDFKAASRTTRSIMRPANISGAYS